jgi:hypothetical protein
MLAHVAWSGLLVTNFRLFVVELGFSYVKCYFAEANEN